MRRKNHTWRIIKLHNTTQVWSTGSEIHFLQKNRQLVNRIKSIKMLKWIRLWLLMVFQIVDSQGFHPDLRMMKIMATLAIKLQKIFQSSKKPFFLSRVLQNSKLIVTAEFQITWELLLVDWKLFQECQLMKTTSNGRPKVTFYMR